MYYHAIATLSGSRRKSIVNKSEDQILTDFVIPFVRTGIITARWGKKLQSYQVLELRVYGTKQSWRKPSGIPLDRFIGRAPNRYSTFAKRAQRALSVPAHRVFVVMPIQGEEFGSQDEQRILKEFDSRFETIEKLIAKYGAVAVRIDKEHTLDELVKRIKTELERCAFVIADLTDERPSCYYEAGYAEALRKPILFVASKESILNPRTRTKIHFDIHRNVNFFVNNAELSKKLKAAIDKNRGELLRESPGVQGGAAEAHETEKSRKRARSSRASQGRKARGHRRKRPTNPRWKPLEMNEKELAVLSSLARSRSALHLTVLAALAFPRVKKSKANSWVRNSVRKPLQLHLITKPERGTYQLTRTGRQSLGR